MSQENRVSKKDCPAVSGRYYMALASWPFLFTEASGSAWHMKTKELIRYRIWPASADHWANICLGRRAEAYAQWSVPDRETTATPKVLRPKWSRAICPKWWKEQTDGHRGVFKNALEELWRQNFWFDEGGKITLWPECQVLCWKLGCAHCKAEGGLLWIQGSGGRRQQNEKRFAGLEYSHAI